jgi:signal transduction histidine kinase
MQILSKKKAARKHIELMYDVLGDLPRALLDAAKLEQVLNNLIGNAVKFSPPGGSVEIGLTAQGATFFLSLRDHGHGIPPERLKTLFQPFQRGETGTAGEKSIGLGLSIVKRIVEGHGGRIWVESEPDAGAAFYMEIPFQPPA